MMERAFLEESTRTQSDSQIWFDARKGRITASDFYTVHTKVQSLKNKEGVSVYNLVEKLVGDGKDISHIDAIQ